MNILVVLLRLIHIVSAVSWFGMGLTLMLIFPALDSMGDKRYQTDFVLFTRTRLVMLFPIISGVATLMGILLYITGSSANFTTLGNISLGLGALIGIGAAGHGGAATGKYTKEYAAALTDAVKDNQPIPSDKLAKLQELAAKVTMHSRMSAMMTFAALVLMASARYLA
ncbi:MAG TPA: hypothetical protein VHL11_02995 [Phototrophicaceae bacterium]|jgi:uncharacterized membrane protein|nr:hypothetical protein [Phototrophicaceae bacterium]